MYGAQRTHGDKCSSRGAHSLTKRIWGAFVKAVRDSKSYSAKQGVFECTFEKQKKGLSCVKKKERKELKKVTRESGSREDQQETIYLEALELSSLPSPSPSPLLDSDFFMLIESFSPSPLDCSLDSSLDSSEELSCPSIWA